MANLSDIFKGKPDYSSLFSPFVNAFTPSNMPVINGTPTPSAYGPNLSYTPYTPAPAAPVVAPPVVNTARPPVTAPAPVVNSAPAPAPVRSKYINPATGAYYTPQEYADSIATKLPVGGTGDIGNYAGNAAANPNQTTQQMQNSAYTLNNTRNDIATGTTDPYKVGAKSGMSYSGAELAAIEKAYAGIYDPALKDVFTKLDLKQKEDAAKLEQKNKLEQMAQQHVYNMAEKGLTGTGLSTSEYVKGENPTVDAWAQRIFDGTAKITDIPVSDKGMRNAVTVALTASGNDLMGKPTKTELGQQTLDSANKLMEMFNAGQGTSMVGSSRIFGGGIAFPGTNSADFETLFNNLLANRSLEGVKFLKGQGQVSDAERLLLKQAMNNLSLSQSEDAFKKNLQTIIDKLNGGQGGISVTDPDGGVHMFSTQADADSFKKAAGII